MNVFGLFAGIGGLELGLAGAGHETTALSEIWAPACAVLADRIAAPNLGDVRAVRSLPHGCELLTAGFPCQDLSQAGFTEGITGRRSGLVGAVFDLLDRQRVPWVLLENVSFMLRLDGGRAMAQIAAAFEERGYRWAYRVVNSLSFLPQRRERVFFLASRDADPSDVLLVDDLDSLPQAVTGLGTHAHGFYWTEGVRGLGWGPDCIPTLKNGSTVGIPSPPAILLPDGAIITPDIRDAERLQGFDEDWTAAASLAGRSSWRWSLVGNAVTVPVARWLGGRLTSPGRFDLARSAPFTGVWPRAARWTGERRERVLIGDRPCHAPRAALHDFLRHPGKPLSAKATAGFLARTQRSSLRFPPGFLDKVKDHLARMTNGDKLAA